MDKVNAQGGGNEQQVVFGDTHRAAFDLGNGAAGGLERTEAVANGQAAKAEATEDMKPAEKISPVTKETPRVRSNIKLNVPPPRRSRGIGV
jgi:hypothetical protein